MALKKNISNYQSPSVVVSTLGIQDVQELYIRIDRFAGQGTNCNFVLGYYNKIIEDSVEVLEKLNFPDIPYSFEMTEDGSLLDVNIRQQGYNFLKTLPEFADCEDC